MASVALAVASPAWAQRPAGDTTHHRSPPGDTHFFDDETPVVATLTANMGRLRRDRGETVPWRPATLSFTSADGQAATVPIRVKTRGIWRRKECGFPPLRLDFGSKTSKGTPFEGLDRPKLVNYCQDRDDYEQYVLQEFELYRVYQRLTPVSHRARLLRLTYMDSGSAKPLTTRYAIVLEEPDAIAHRTHGARIVSKGAHASDFNAFGVALAGVFQYMIGNSDWSTQQLHNAEILTDSTGDVFLVPYDFDFSGAVNARYATPDPRLGLPSVRQRVYRGHCAPPAEFTKVYARFNERRPAIYALYSDSIGKLLRPNIAKETLEYFDDFYEVINSRRAKALIVDACSETQ